jgi:phage/plasmid-associated DNA primase
VTASETSDGRRLSEALVKKCTGGEHLRARRLYENGFSFLPRFKLWLSTNHRPQIVGTDHAIWRRIRLLPFTVTIPEGERDRDLPDKLAAELPGILAWAVEGCRQWLVHGEQPPGAVLQATAQYQRDMDALGNWIEERCELRPGVEETVKALYQDYANCCDCAGEEPLKQRTFGTRLTERGCGDRRDGKARYRTGIRLRDTNRPEQASLRGDTSRDVSRSITTASFVGTQEKDGHQTELSSGGDTSDASDMSSRNSVHETSLREVPGKSVTPVIASHGADIPLLDDKTLATTVPLPTCVDCGRPLPKGHRYRCGSCVAVAHERSPSYPSTPRGP